MTLWLTIISCRCLVCCHAATLRASRKVVLDGKTFAPFGMLPHAVEPVKAWWSWGWSQISFGNILSKGKIEPWFFGKLLDRFGKPFSGLRPKNCRFDLKVDMIWCWKNRGHSRRIVATKPLIIIRQMPWQFRFRSHFRLSSRAFPANQGTKQKRLQLHSTFMICNGMYGKTTRLYVRSCAEGVSFRVKLEVKRRFLLNFGFHERQPPEKWPNPKTAGKFGRMYVSSPKIMFTMG